MRHLFRLATVWLLSSWLLSSIALTSLVVGPASATSPIRNEPGDPYNRPTRLPKPMMICAVGINASTPPTVCRARLAMPLTLCRCVGVEGVGLRYFTYEPVLPPTIFSFDGYAR